MSSMSPVPHTHHSARAVSNVQHGMYPAPTCRQRPPRGACGHGSAAGAGPRQATRAAKRGGCPVSSNLYAGAAQGAERPDRSPAARASGSPPHTHTPSVAGDGPEKQRVATALAPARGEEGDVARHDTSGVPWVRACVPLAQCSACRASFGRGAPPSECRGVGGGGRARRRSTGALPLEPPPAGGSCLARQGRRDGCGPSTSVGAGWMKQDGGGHLQSPWQRSRWRRWGCCRRGGGGGWSGWARGWSRR